MNKKIVPYYSGNIFKSEVLGLLSIQQWVNAHKEPKANVVKTIDLIRKATSKGDMKTKTKLKESLYYITPCVHIPIGVKRRYANISFFTGMCQIDVDKVATIKEAQELRNYLFDTYNPIICAYLSPSKLGVKCIMRIPIVETIDVFKDYFAAIETELKQVHSGFDHACSNAVLPLFISIDQDIKYRTNATTWNVKEDRTVDYVALNKLESPAGREMTDVKKQLQTIDLFKSKIDEIIDNDGHPRLRSACLVLGSRVAAGYIDGQQAIELVEWSIQTNAYLKKKYKTYMRSAHWALSQGIKHGAKYY